MGKVVLISCVSKKISRRAKAMDLYNSTLFRMNLAFARQMKPDKIFILSAKHGLLGLNRVIGPYEKTLNAMPISEVRRWALRVRKQMKGRVDIHRDSIVFLAGERYRKYLLPLCKKSHVPLKGLGIGRQLQYLKKRIGHAL